MQSQSWDFGVYTQDTTKRACRQYHTKNVSTSFAVLVQGPESQEQPCVIEEKAFVGSPALIGSRMRQLSYDGFKMRNEKKERYFWNCRAHAIAFSLAVQVMLCRNRVEIVVL